MEAHLGLVLLCIALVQGRDLRRLDGMVHETFKIPAGGERILDIAYSLRPAPQHDCLMSDYESWYSRCEMENVTPECKVIKSCPTDCEAADGTRYAINGESWREGDNLCKCSHAHSIYFNVPAIPPGGLPFPPVNDCKLDGCRNYKTDEVIKEGDSFEGNDGRMCTCMPGTDPNIMDATTLFHLKCATINSTQAIEVVPAGGDTAPTTEAPEVVTPEQAATPTPTEAADQPAEPAVSVVDRAADDPVIAEADLEIAKAMAEEK